MRDEAKETMLNVTNLVDSGAFLINGGSRCLLAHLYLYSGMDVPQ